MKKQLIRAVGDLVQRYFETSTDVLRVEDIEHELISRWVNAIERSETFAHSCINFLTYVSFQIRSEHSHGIPGDHPRVALERA